MWAIDGLANFLPYAGLPLLAMAPATLFVKRRLIAALLIVPAVVWLVILLTPMLFISQRDSIAPDAPRLRVITANVLMTNEDLDALSRDVLAQDADVVVFEELRHDLAVVAPSLAAAYPHRFSTTSPWVTIASRSPLEDPRVFEIEADDRGRDLLSATVDIGGQRVTLIAVHFMPPLNGEAFEVNRQQRTVLERAVADVEGALMVVGDFNATTLSPTFARLLLGTDLRIASTNRVMTPTYHAYGRLGVRIDHVLVRGLQVAGDHVFDLTGSDHRGLSVDLALPVTTRCWPRTASRAALPDTISRHLPDLICVSARPSGLRSPPRLHVGGCEVRDEGRDHPVDGA